MAAGSRAASYTEGQPPVRRGVRDRGERQREQVRGLRAGQAAQQHVQHQVGRGACQPYAGEPHQLSGQPDRHAGDSRFQRRTAELAAQVTHGQRTAGEGTPEPGDAFEVGQRGGRDVNAAVGIVDPVDRDLIDAQPGPFGEDEQLRVEEPAGVLDQRQQPRGDVGADGFEPALGVGETGGERAAQDEVVAAGDHFPLRAPDDPRVTCQPGPDREIGVPGDQRGDQR